MINGFSSKRFYLTVIQPVFNAIGITLYQAVIVGTQVQVNLLLGPAIEYIALSSERFCSESNTAPRVSGDLPCGNVFQAR